MLGVTAVALFYQSGAEVAVCQSEHDCLQVCTCLWGSKEEMTCSSTCKCSLWAHRAQKANSALRVLECFPGSVGRPFSNSALGMFADARTDCSCRSYAHPWWDQGQCQQSPGHAGRCKASAGVEALKLILYRYLFVILLAFGRGGGIRANVYTEVPIDVTNSVTLTFVMSYCRIPIETYINTFMCFTNDKWLFSDILLDAHRWT